MHHNTKTLGVIQVDEFVWEKLTREEQQESERICDEELELGELTEERKKAIEHAILDSKKYGYDLDSTRFFFMKQFYETDFRKNTPRAPMETSIFALTTALGSTEIPDIEQLVQILSQKTWG